MINLSSTGCIAIKRSFKYFFLNILLLNGNLDIFVKKYEKRYSKTFVKWQKNEG